MNVDQTISDKGPSWIRPTILQKGLGLVLVPLFLQGVIFWQFNSLMGKTDEITRAESKQSRLVEELNKMLELFTIAWGTILAELPEGPGHVVADLDFASQQEIRSLLPSLAHRRPEAYGHRSATTRSQ